MITAPLLAQGVKVDLPQATSKPVETKDQEPLIVSVDINGDYYLNISGDEERIDHETLVQKVVAVMSLRPGTQGVIRGDAEVTYAAFALPLLHPGQMGLPVHHVMYVEQVEGVQAPQLQRIVHLEAARGGAGNPHFGRGEQCGPGLQCLE